MRLPAIAPGTVEQATYTWTRQTITGVAGEGFEVVSPGLRASIPWLQSLDTGLFRILDDGVRHESEAYSSWRQFSAVCVACAGPLNLVYRKIASAGTDAVRRNRSLVHILVGRAEELSLATVSDDDPRWLTADDSPSDRPPQLNAFEVAELTPRATAHTCDELDEHAVELLERLVKTPCGLRASSDQIEPAKLVTALLAAVPSALWGSLDVNWYVGVRGPVAEVSVRDPSPEQRAEPARDRDEAGIAACRLQLDVQRTWSCLPAQRRTWADFGQAFLTDRSASASDASRATTPEAVAVPSDAMAEAESWQNVIALALGLDRWNATHALAERDIDVALTALEHHAASEGDWEERFARDEWRALLGDVTSLSAFRRVRRFFAAVGISPRQLASLWRATGLAPVGFALLCAEPEDHPEKRWTLPRALDSAEIDKLVGVLARTDNAEIRLARLIAGGMGATPPARRHVMSALAAADVPPRIVFEQVLPRSDLPPGTLLAFVREHLDAFGEWLKLPEAYEEALARGLRKRSFIPHSLRRGEDDW